MSLVAHGTTDLFSDPDGEFAPDVVGGIVRPLLIQKLKDAVTLVLRMAVKRIGPGQVVLDYTGAFAPHLSAVRMGPVDEQVIQADSVVLGIRRRPADELFEALQGQVENLVLVGDVVEPWTVYNAVAEGSAAGRSVGGDRVALTMAVAA